MTDRMNKTKALSPKQKVKAKYPDAFGWRQFSVSDYSIESGDGKTLATALYAKDAWARAAEVVEEKPK